MHELLVGKTVDLIFVTGRKLLVTVRTVLVTVDGVPYALESSTGVIYVWQNIVSIETIRD